MFITHLVMDLSHHITSSLIHHFSAHLFQHSSNIPMSYILLPLTPDEVDWLYAMLQQHSDSPHGSAILTTIEMELANGDGDDSLGENDNGSFPIVSIYSILLLLLIYFL